MTIKESVNDEKVSNMQLTPFNKYLLSTYYIYMSGTVQGAACATEEHRQVIISVYWVKQPGWYQNTEGGVWTEAGG